MACEPSELCMAMEDSDNESSFDQYLLNELPSTSDEDTEKQRHVSVVNYEENDSIPTLPHMSNLNDVVISDNLQCSIPHSNIQNLRSYLQTQCYDG